jgi:hypothetical protein
MYFKYSYENAKQYDFFYIFEKLGHMQLKHLIFLSFFFCFKHSKTYKKIQTHTPIFLLINPYTLQLHFFTNHQNLK